VFRDHQRIDAALASGKSIEEALRSSNEEEDEDSDVIPPMKASERLERESFLKALDEALSREPTPEELRNFAAWEARREHARNNDPLSVASREYADLTRELLKALRCLVQDRGDTIVMAAVETIERFAFTIAVKTWRAVAGTIDRSDDDDEEWAEASIADGNGCAKLVRLMVAESREAWEVLRHTGHGDGVPARMIERLRRLDTGLARRFPTAMDFVRPGLDEDE
jgi:hypothetical protein